MSGLAYSAALVLAAVFGWAAVAKLRAPAATTAGFAGLGLPLPRVLARVVPGMELVFVTLLIGAPVWGAASALVLLAAFSAVLAVNFGSSGAGCNCFGSSPSGDPVSPLDIVRNLFLAAGAVIATGASGPVWPALPEAVIATTVAVLASLVLRRLRRRPT